MDSGKDCFGKTVLLKLIIYLLEHITPDKKNAIVTDNLLLSFIM